MAQIWDVTLQVPKPTCDLGLEGAGCGQGYTEPSTAPWCSCYSDSESVPYCSVCCSKSCSGPSFSCVKSSVHTFVRLGIGLDIAGFPGGSEVKNLPANAGDTGSIPRSGRAPGEGNGYPLQYSCLENSMYRGAWWATVHGVTEEPNTTKRRQLDIVLG